MSVGTFIGFRGKLGTVFSRGLHTMATALEAAGWRCRVFPDTGAWQAAAWAASQSGPLVIAWHSAGASSADEFADKLARDIDLGVNIDAWFPHMQAHPRYKRVVSFIAESAGRWHVEGPNVARKIKIKGTTHTTVDDAPALHEIVMQEIEQLQGKAPVEQKARRHPPLSVRPAVRNSIGHSLPNCARHGAGSHKRRSTIATPSSTRSKHTAMAPTKRWLTRWRPPVTK